MAVILIFQILGTYWDTLYYNSIVSGILGSFAGVFILGYYLTREQVAAQKQVIADLKSIPHRTTLRNKRGTE